MKPKPSALTGALCLLALGAMPACGARSGQNTARTLQNRAPAPEPEPAAAAGTEPADLESEETEDGYELVSESPALAGSFSARGKSEQIVLREYSGPSKAQSEEAAEQGFEITPRRAELVLLDARGNALAFYTVREWENGWEWGSSVALEGVFPLGKTGRSAIVITEQSHGEGPGLDSRSQRVVLIEVDENLDFAEIWSESANEVSLTIAGSELRVSLTTSEGWSDEDNEVLTERELIVTHCASGIDATEVPAPDDSDDSDESDDSD